MISARGNIWNNNGNALRNPVCTVKTQLGSVAMPKLAALNPSVAKALLTAPCPRKHTQTINRSPTIGAAMLELVDK
eukprot:4535009-Lingulodinium_polyedra.AAC.1